MLKNILSDIRLWRNFCACPHTDSSELSVFFIHWLVQPGIRSWGRARSTAAGAAVTKKQPLVVVFMKGVNPTLSGIVERISRRQSLFFTWVLIAVLSADMLLSATAVYRWSERLRDIPPASAYEEFLDRHYTDEMLVEIYPNITIGVEHTGASHC